jgi:hypothetical protein
LHLRNAQEEEEDDSEGPAGAGSGAGGGGGGGGSSKRVKAKGGDDDDDDGGLIADSITLNVDVGTKTDAKGDLTNFPLSPSTLTALKQKCACCVHAVCVEAWVCLWRLTLAVLCQAGTRVCLE